MQKIPMSQPPDKELKIHPATKGHCAYIKRSDLLQLKLLNPREVPVTEKIFPPGPRRFRVTIKSDGTKRLVSVE